MNKNNNWLSGVAKNIRNLLENAMKNWRRGTGNPVQFGLQFCALVPRSPPTRGYCF